MSAATGEQRPWGRWDTLHEEPGFKVKRLMVESGRRLSYQIHEHRVEHWTVVTGRGSATVNDKRVELLPGSTLTIPAQTPHRLANEGDGPLIVMEVQTGSHLGEDDVCRLSDDFGRT